MNNLFNYPEHATPINDCSGLIPEWVHNIDDLNRVEAENILSAQRKYLRKSVPSPDKWFQIKDLKKIHQEMFGKVWDWAGCFRKSTTSIGIAPHLIAAQLGAFCREVHSWQIESTNMTFIERSARIHHQLVSIHPFENGNGRFSRFVADRFLISYRCPHPIWPEYLNHESTIRQDYIRTLKAADRGDYNLLIEFMKQFGAKDPIIN